MFSFSKGDSNRSAFATTMLLYIEPLFLRFKKELAGVKIAGHPLKVGGHVDNQFFFVEKNDDISDDPETPTILCHVDDQILFVKCDEDIRRVWGIVESFEDCTNALINRQKTRLLGLGIWKERK